MSNTFHGDWNEDDKSAVEAALFVSGNKDDWAWYMDDPETLYGQRVGYNLPTVFGHNISEFVEQICMQCRVIEREKKWDELHTELKHKGII